MSALVLYTDGGASPNPGPGGWGVVAVCDGNVDYELSGSAAETTNNRMELTAALHALKSQPVTVPLRVVTDSQYLRLGITTWIHNWRRNRWMRGRGSAQEPVKNADLWKELDALASVRTIEWSWVKGHAGNRFNERADELATREIEAIAGGGERADAGSTGVAAASEPVPPAEVVAYLVVRFARGRGGWCVQLEQGDETHRLEQATGPAQSANRLELEAGLAALTDQRANERTLEVHCGDYLRRGVTEWLANWQRAGWRTAGGDPVKNRDLWEKLAATLDPQWQRFVKADTKSPLFKQLKKSLDA